MWSSYVRNRPTDQEALTHRRTRGPEHLDAAPPPRAQGSAGRELLIGGAEPGRMEVSSL